MTTAHKNLTGTDLHEIKGASAATYGQQPIADGLGSAPFGSGGGLLMHVREEQASGVASVTSAATGSFIQTALNTVKTNEITGASLGSNRVTLPVGTYFISIVVPAYLVTNSSNFAARAVLCNVTASSYIVLGQSVRGLGGSGGSGGTFPLTAVGRIILTGTTVLEIQHYLSSGSVGAAFSVPGFNEVYSEMLIWKVA